MFKRPDVLAQGGGELLRVDETDILAQREKARM
jgi:hypothetical protein